MNHSKRDYACIMTPESEISVECHELLAARVYVLGYDFKDHVVFLRDGRTRGIP